MELISVIIPVYNVEKYLSECIESVFKQTYQNLEILLIDDGSTDGSGRLCDEYAKNDSRIKVIHKENGGVSSARNRGLDIAQGEYITFIDGDDFVAENYVQVLYNNLKENDSDLSFCKYIYFSDNDLKPCEETFPKKIIVNKDSKEFLDFLARFIFYRKRIHRSICRILYRKDSIENIRFDISINIGEDFLFLIEVISAVKIISFTEQILYYYRTNNISAMHSYKKNYLHNQINIYERIKKVFFSIEFSKTKKVLNLYALELCYACFSNEIKFKQKNRRKNIKEIRKNELYQYFTLKNGLWQGKLSVVIKFLIVWFLVKTRLV